MKFYSLKCPSCGSNLEIEDGLEYFYCKFCGAKIMTDHVSKSELKIREMEHAERMADKEYKSEMMYAIMPMVMGVLTVALIIFLFVFVSSR